MKISYKNSNIILNLYIIFNIISIEKKEGVLMKKMVVDFSGDSGNQLLFYGMSESTNTQRCRLQCKVCKND